MVEVPPCVFLQTVARGAILAAGFGPPVARGAILAAGFGPPVARGAILAAGFNVSDKKDGRATV